jgi:glycosyltransferase involved in cell wall biosynthesis
MWADIDISIIIPVFNEERNVIYLADEIQQVMTHTKWSWECIWVDDGSRDNTSLELIHISEKYSQHHYIMLDSNYGQSAALFVGFKNAHGRIIVTLDGDGQNDPRDIPLIIKFLERHNADMVNGWRRDRKDPFIKKISSRIANAFRNWITNENITDVGCSMRAFKKECIGRLFLFKGMHRFLPTLVKYGGYEKILEIPVNHRPRWHGFTKYGINNRLWVGIIDTLAVRWFQLRAVYPEIKNSSLDIKEEMEK